jgi:NAD(P)-dependent dehydrogenase (short-subunit alcohol dehydrogenase family)
MKESLGIQNTVAIVTGVSGALGEAIVKKLNSKGHKVFGIDYIQNKNDALDYFYQLDLNDFVKNTGLQKNVFNKVKEVFPNNKIILLVNNAAFQYVTDVHPISYDIMNRTLNVNVLAPYYLITLFAEQLTNSKGSVVNISSIHARLTKKGFTAYTISKAALTSLTKSLSIEYGDKFRINCVEPASIDTDMLRDGFNYEQSKLDILSSYHPQNRIATPEEIAELIYLIACGNVQFLHGACIDVSGGISNVLHDPA